MQKSNDTKIKTNQRNQNIINSHVKLSDFSIDNSIENINDNNNCFKFKNSNNLDDQSVIINDSKSERLIAAQQQHLKSLNGKNHNEDDYDSTGQNKQTDESSSHDDDESSIIARQNFIKIVENNQNLRTNLKSDKSSHSDKNRIRGILKYPPGWPRRTLSESYPLHDQIRFSRSLSSDSYIGYYGTSIDSSPAILSDCYECDYYFGDDDNHHYAFADVDDEDEDGFAIDDLNKPKKCVTFSDKQATYVFRPGSSILGRRQKNQKKALKKKERELRKMISSLENLDNDDDDDHDDGGKSRQKQIEELRLRFANVNTYDVDSNDSSMLSSSLDSNNSSDYLDVSTTSASDCSTSDLDEDGDHQSIVATSLSSTLNEYEDENQPDSGQATKKSKRKLNRRRRRNRKNKLSMKTLLETGGYDSD